jgi:hypothetical protein
VGGFLRSALLEAATFEAALPEGCSRPRRSPRRCTQSSAEGTPPPSSRETTAAAPTNVSQVRACWRQRCDAVRVLGTTLPKKPGLFHSLALKHTTAASQDTSMLGRQPVPAGAAVMNMSDCMGEWFQVQTNWDPWVPQTRVRGGPHRHSA